MNERISPTLRFLSLVLLSAAAPSAPLHAQMESAPARAAPAAPALDLPGAIGLALARNPELAAANARIDAAAGRSQQAALWTNPELTVDAEDWPVHTGRGFSDAKQTVGVAQTLPFPGKKNLDRKIGTSGVRLSEAEAAQRRRVLVREVKAAFFQAVAADEFARISDELVRVAEAAAASAEKRVRAGAAPEQELLRAEVALEQARTERAGYDRDAQMHRQTLKELLGLVDAPLPALRGDLDQEWGRELLDVSFEDKLPTHPEMQAAGVNSTRAELEWRRARLEPYPDVRVAVSGGRVGESGRSILQLGFAVPLPLIDRGQGAQREAKANVRAAVAAGQSVEQRLRREWAVAVARARAAVAQVTGYRERIVPKAGTALRLVQTGFDEGKFTLIDLLDTQRTAAEARLAYTQKLLELNLGFVDLEALAGGGDHAAPASNSLSSSQIRPAVHP